MATRPVYIPLDHAPFYRKEEVDFTWNPGLAPSQKKKNVKAIREAFLHRFPEAHYLEVSTKSDTELGVSLSPFNLELYLKSFHKSFPVENVYQASKTYELGGPYVDLLSVSPLKAKQDTRKDSSGPLISFSLEHESYAPRFDALFFIWLYDSALLQHPELAKEVEQYNAFSDVEYAPKKGRPEANQARACATFVGLSQAHLLSKIESYPQFVELFSKAPETPVRIKKTPPAQSKPKPRVKKVRFSVGNKILHPEFGLGTIKKVSKNTALISFDFLGPKEIQKDYLQNHCKLIGKE